ncbi:MAG: ATP-binding protein [Clostridia bacterium]|nr:ATP-binding protein [Clostridia bacterium]
MQHLINNLLLYTTPSKDSILERLAEALSVKTDGQMGIEEKRRAINAIAKNILDLSTAYGFDTNLWQCYLTYYLVMNENSFSLTCERVGASEGGSINRLAKQDLEIFHKLFHYDFSIWEQKLGTDVFSILTDYVAIPKRDCLYNADVSLQIRLLRERLVNAKDADEMFDHLTAYYRNCGVGMFGMNRAFRIAEGEDDLDFLPVQNADKIMLSDLVGYEHQKGQLKQNTKAFVEGKRANNVLLYGDSGTGKSSSVKAVLNEYFEDGLRMIEIYKHQFGLLSAVISAIKKRNYRFIIYIDDLSFEEHEIEYKYLKAVIEGGVETRPENILIYATSNRRHLIRETWSDRNDMEHDGDIHRSDTMEEKLSLAERFGLSINYSDPSHTEYLTIVRTLAEREGLDVDDETLCREANRFELRHGGVSGRVARQFIDDMKTKEG